MTKLLLVAAALADLAIAALLIGVSGFIFGQGPESIHGGPLVLVAYSAAVIACIAAPLIGLVFRRYGKIAPGLVIAWTPPVGALLALVLPPY